jgi:pimeloyl-ACP methyl ester carboxylesterase
MKLKVPGATLHWQSMGEGPTVLMLQGGDGDADTSSPIAARSSGFRLVSYDRRGLSRSALDGPQGITLETHTDDAARVLEAAGGAPAFVFGTSIGAMMGLDLLARYPALVKKLVAHEPPATDLLAETEQAGVQRAREEIDALLKTRGPLHAMRRFLAATRVDFTEREPGVPLPPATTDRIKGLQFFLEHDAPAVWRFRLDLAALKRQAEKLVIGAGVRSSDSWLHRAAEALSRATGAPLVEFPGGHAGYQTHPGGFAEKLADLMQS